MQTVVRDKNLHASAIWIIPVCVIQAVGYFCVHFFETPYITKNLLVTKTFLVEITKKCCIGDTLYSPTRFGFPVVVHAFGKPNYN